MSEYCYDGQFSDLSSELAEVNRNLEKLISLTNRNNLVWERDSNDEWGWRDAETGELCQTTTKESQLSKLRKSMRETSEKPEAKF